MNVLAESNFLLEIALRQSEYDHAVHILQLAENGKIRLVVPAYALAEPFHKLGRVERERRQLMDGLDRELGQMSRSADFADIRSKSTAIMAALAGKSDVDKREFDAVSVRVLKVAEVIPLTAMQLRAGISRQLVDLGPQDALIFAAAQEFLRTRSGEPSIFVNKNSKDFLAESVSQDLERLGCKVLVRFSAANSYIENWLARGA